MNPVEEQAEGPLHWLYLQYRQMLTVLVFVVCVSTAALWVTLAQLFTGFRARQFGQNIVATHIARLILRLLSIELAVIDPRGLLRADAQVVYIGNHSSTLDFIVVTALGLPNTRGFLARKNAIMLPLGLLGWALGHFFTPPQRDTQARRRCFAAACELLRETGEPIYVTPEGTRHVGEGVGPFNRGAFHLAQALGWPIQPVYIDVPAAINPGKGYKTRPGTVTVRVDAPIATTDWQLDDLPAYIDAARQRYVEYPKDWS